MGDFLFPFFEFIYEFLNALVLGGEYNGHSLVSLNDIPLSEIPGTDFCVLLLSIFLGFFILFVLFKLFVSFIKYLIQ